MGDKKKANPPNLESLRSALGEMKLLYDSQFFKNAVESYWQLAKFVAPLIEEMQRTVVPYLLKAVPALKYYVIIDSYFYISDACFFKELEDRYSNTTDKNILLNFIEEFYYRNNYEEICRLIDELEDFEFIEKRFHIIKSVKSVVSSGLKDNDIANVVIPVVVSQIDGVVKDFYVEIDPGVAEKGTLKHKKVLAENSVINDISFSNYTNILNPIFYLFEFERGIRNAKKKNENNQEEFFIEKASEEELEKYVLSRNSIMHGEKVDYGKKIELIRVILFYDTVVKAITNAINDINKKTMENDEEIKIVEGGE